MKKHYWHTLLLLSSSLLLNACSSSPAAPPEAEPKYQRSDANSKAQKLTKKPTAKQPKNKWPTPISSNTKPTSTPKTNIAQSNKTNQSQAISASYAKNNFNRQPGYIRNLPPTVSRALSAQGIASHGISVYVQPVNNSTPLLTHKADTPRNPASVMKLVTSYAALGMLGPNYRWPTEVYTTGSVVGGTLKGDLIFKGYGSPDFTPKDLEMILQNIRSKGIRNIEGNLVFDNSHFVTSGRHAGAFDGKPHSLYNAQPDALLYNERTSCFVIRPRGGKVDVSCPTPARNVKIVNNIRSNNGACRGKNARPSMKITPQGRNVTVTFSGTYSTRCGEKKYFKVVSDPANMLFGGIWQTWVGKMGGSIRGGFAQQRTPSNAQLLYTHYSKPLSQILPTINKKSNNVMARQLLLSIAAKRYGAPGTPQKGAQAIGKWLESRGMRFPELRIENGSGLSRVSKITARHVGQLLTDAYKSPFRNEFMRSLAVMGVDGTLKKRLVKSAVRGRGNFKTGSLKNVRGIAGYVRASDGQTYIVSVLHNDPKARSRGRAAHDEVIKWAYTHPRQFASR